MIEKELATYIRQNERDKYLSIRYPSLPEWEEVVFENENFTGTDFRNFPISMNVFKNCNLDNAIFPPGQPVRIENSSARHLDIRGIHIMIEAYNSDFTNLHYNKDTVLAKPENGISGSSAFYNCLLTEEDKNHFRSQGVTISS